MESKRQTESVLAKLMGLERPQPSKLVVHGRRRVYSESYLQDIANLISQQQKWSFDRFSLDVDDTMLERRDSSEDLRSYSSSEESLQRYRTENEMFQKLWLLNSSEKGYSSRGSAYSHKKIESVSQTPIRNALQNQTKPFSVMRRKGECLGKRERDCSSGREALKKGSTTTNSIAKQVADSLKHSVWHNYLKGSQKQDVLNTSLQAKINSKVGEQCISNSMSFPSSGSSIFKNKKINAHKDWCLDMMDWDSSYSNSWREVNCKSEEDLSMRNSPSFTSLQSEKDASSEETHSTTTESSELVGKDLLEEKNSDCVSPKEKCVKVDATSQQLEDDTSMENGSHPYPTEAYKPNLNAASNIKDLSPGSHCSAFHGSELKLQQSVGTFHYPRAKRHKRVYVEDSKEGHSGNKKEETRALSYIIEVLAGSGIQYEKLETCYKLGQPLENPLSPFVFDSLEKKYSKQPSWLKSDRRLLYDRIKCALSDILRPNTGIINTWRTYKTDRLLLHCNQDIISEELLNVLVNQEKDAKRMPSHKVVGLDCDWLDLEEHIMIVVKEIEEVLINELVEEIVSTELLIRTSSK